MKKRIESISLSGIRSFAQMCQEIEGLVFLTIGEPDLDTPQPIKDAAIQALYDNKTHYPPALGLTSLRQRIADKESEVYGPVSLDHVMITDGATEALVLAFWSLFSEGDELIMPTPGYIMYQSQVALAGGKTVYYDTEEDNYQIDEGKLRALITDKTRAIVLTSPNNPTGSVYDEASIQAVANVMRDYPRIYAILDEVYQSFVYEDTLTSLRKENDLCDRIIVVQSFSKSHAMTGWRLGYVVAHPQLIDQMHKLHQNLVTGVASFIQEAALVAYDVDTRYMLEEYRTRRDYVYQRLVAMKLPVLKPQGAFYIFPDISEFGLDSYSFSYRAAHEAKVGVVPGIYFGSDKRIRISYCYGMDDLRESLNRLEYFVAKLRNENN